MEEIKLLITVEGNFATLPINTLLLFLIPLTTDQGVIHRMLKGDTETGVRERANFKLQDPRGI